MKYKAIKVMLLPNNWQKSRLFQFAGASRFAYNWALHKEMESLNSGNWFISDSVLRKEFTKLRNSEEYSWLQSISNNVTKQAIKDLVKSYIRYFNLRKSENYKPYTKKQIEHAKRIGKQLTEYDKQGHPKYKSRKNHTDCGFFQDNFKIQFTDSTVRIEKLCDSGNRSRRNVKCNVRLAEVGRIPILASYMNPRITFDGLHWWVSVVVEDSTDVTKYVPESDGIGLDVGIKDFAILSDSTKYANINKSSKIRRLEKRKRRLQKSISRKYVSNRKGGSYQKTNNIIKSEKSLLKLNKRLRNIRRNQRSHIVSDIINRKPRFICIEDLNISGMMKNKHLSKSVQNQGFYDFRRLLEYNSDKYNIPLIVANRWYPSSKTCNCCGTIKKDLKLSDRIFRCDCGYSEDRDVNAAKNLKSYGELHLV